MVQIEDVLLEIKQEETEKKNRNLRDQYLNRDMMAFNRELQKSHFNNNQRVQGLSKGKTMRHVAEIPWQVYDYFTTIYGPDYFRKMENIRKFKQYLVVERI